MIGLPTVSKLRAHFFAGMCEGWASGNIARKVHNETNGEMYDYCRGVIWLHDEYHTSGFGGGFEGSTNIFFLGDSGEWSPIWTMHYVGFTDEEASAFLKQALMENYSKGIFLGGRGPRGYVNRDNLFRYRNNCINGHLYDYLRSDEYGYGDSPGESFACFNGSEEICEIVPPEVRRGWCEYFGHLLVPKGLLQP